MLQWSSTNQSTLNGVKVLVYGGSGVGKTRLCATAPYPCIASAEAGTLSLSRVDIPMCQIKTLDDLKDFYRWATGSVESKYYMSLCLDSCTEIAESLLAHLKPTVKDPRQAYGEMLDQMMILVRSFRDIPGKNVYFSAKMEYSKDTATGVHKYLPMMPGQKLGPQLPYLFDEVFHLGVAKGQDGSDYTYLRTKADFQYEAKDRSGSLDSMEPPDLGRIFNKITGGRTQCQS
jgi:hypothetical protein